MITNQSYLFLIFTLDGFIIGILFDFFRILRKSFRTSNLVTYIEDILFWILTGILVLYSIFTFNNGEIRFFMFLGIIIGITMYMLLLSNYIVKINVYIIKVIKKIFSMIFSTILIPITAIMKVFKKICFKPINFLFINVKNMTKNIQVFTKKSKKIEDFKKEHQVSVGIYPIN